jgi:hypothetical protein
LALVVTACARRPPPPAGAIAWPADRATCFAALQREAVAFTDWLDAPTAAVCTVPAPVIVSRSTAAMAPTLRTSCPMMLAWARFEPEMQRLAIRRLGSEIAEIHHYGSYNCRRMSGNQRRMSLHSTGQALDIAGFTTADGRYISVGEGWRGGRSERAFLADLSHAACRHFNVVLTPNHDRAHHDHLHVDIGPWRFCGA